MERTETITLRVPSQTRYLSLIGACTVETCRHVERLPDPEQTTYDVQLAVNEAVANVIEHAYAGRLDGVVEVLFHLHPDRLVVDVVDWGKSFDFTATPEPNLSQPQEGGYGIFLMQRLMDEVIYRADPDQGNRLRMVKRLGVTR